MIAITFDVYYYEDFANVAALIFEIGENEKILKEYTKIVNEVNPYEPGNFYRRELPCLLSILEDVKEKYDMMIVDSYVYLKENHKGLGAYLYEYFNKKIPVIGFAKNHYKDVENFRELRRGKSNKSTYITSAGIDLSEAYEMIKNLKGNFRIPDVLKRVDALSREKDFDFLDKGL